MIDAFKGGSNWSRTMRIRQNVRHAFGIPALTKSHFGKNQSYVATIWTFSSVNDFSATNRLRILKFGTKLDSDESYFVTKKSHILLISPFFSIFLSLQ